MMGCMECEGSGAMGLRWSTAVDYTAAGFAVDMY